MPARFWGSGKVGAGRFGFSGGGSGFGAVSPHSGIPYTNAGHGEPSFLYLVGLQDVIKAATARMDRMAYFMGLGL